MYLKDDLGAVTVVEVDLSLNVRGWVGFVCFSVVEDWNPSVLVVDLDGSLLIKIST